NTSKAQHPVNAALGFGFTHRPRANSAACGSLRQSAHDPEMAHGSSSIPRAERERLPAPAPKPRQWKPRQPTDQARVSALLTGRPPDGKVRTLQDDSEV